MRLEEVQVRSFWPPAPRLKDQYSWHESLDESHVTAALFWGKNMGHALLRPADRVLDDLAADEPDFACWKPFLSLSGGSDSYADAAEAAGLTEGAARVAVHRLRKRYRLRIRQEIARTLVDESMVEEEMRALFAALTDRVVP
ncbi:MAG: hypothetical protein KDN22_13685 [Verrucomicrobiae bacterium]|nr:hypothetical protein [Verrucomicrobiae bacterium]